jgi:cellulose synthase/poly-beta-1,6-N-acetylglucosamine synthase-like glycosyltransferase
MLLGGLFAAPIATVALFVPTRRRANAAGAWPWVRRVVFALASTAVLAAIVAGCLVAVGVTHRNIAAACIAIVIASLAWLPATRSWNARAHLCWSSTTFLFAAYLVFMIHWTFVTPLGVGGTVGGVVLWLLEVFAALLGCAYLWELCDAIGRENWRRRVTGRLPVVRTDGPLPFVSLHVPAHFEPPTMVIATLKSLAALDYPNFEIIAIDDNTDDETLWRPVKEWCDANGAKFVHLTDWPGYKSGALNYALKNVTDPRTELIGVIDADYQLDPLFLRRCAPLFDDPAVGFIQAPQDYRDWEYAPFYRRLYYSYLYFFAVSQPSRNERDGAIFAGTMGLIRRRALEEAGGWDEWCITEDAELSLRLLRSGWSGLHVDQSFGRGVMPLTLEALKGQRFRWCFGGIQMLRQHWRWMLPGRADAQNHMRFGQRWAYLSGAVQWYGDLLGLLFYLFLLVGAANIAFGGGLLFRKLTGFLIAAIPVLVALGLVRAIALLRRGTGASWRDAFGAFMIWQCTSLVVARASVQALYAKEAVFVRTPKTADEPHVFDAVRGNVGETLLGVLGLLGMGAALTRPSGLGGPLVAVLLLWPTLALLVAPVTSFAAQRATLPADLTERRRTEYQRMGAARKVTIATGGLVAAAATTAAVAALLTTGGAQVLSPPLVAPARGHAAPHVASPAPASRSGTSSPAVSSGSSASVLGSPSVTSPSATAKSKPSPSASRPVASVTASKAPTVTPSPTATSAATATP